MTIPVAGMSSSVWDIDIESYISHTFPADLRIELVAPSGKTVTLSSRNGAGASSAYVFNGTLWDDQADDPVTDHDFSQDLVAVHLSPEEPLAFFAERGLAENPNGNWTLRVSDEAWGDVGTFSDWQMVVTTCVPIHTWSIRQFRNDTPYPIISNGGAVTSEISVSNAASSLCGVDIRTTITHSRNQELKIYLESPSGRTVTVSTLNGSGSNNFNETWWTDSYDKPVTDNAFVSGKTEQMLSPEEPFSLLYGENPNGKWKLRVIDEIAGDDGWLQGWLLNVDTCAPGPEAWDSTFGIAEHSPNGTTVGTVLTRQYYKMGKSQRDGGSAGIWPDKMFFTATGAFQLVSAAVFPDAAGMVRFNYRDPATSAVKAFATADVVQGGLARTRIPLDLSIFPGSYYFDMAGSTTKLMRSSTGVSYPYTAPSGETSITGSDAGPAYYAAFYDWEIKGSPVSLTYRIYYGNVNNAFAINKHTGEISVANSQALDFETTASYSLLVYVEEEQENTGKVITVTINLTNIDEIDSDGDGVFDAVDECPTDPNKTKQGICGCGISESDLNGNGVVECADEYGSTNQQGQCVPGGGDCYYQLLKHSACAGANGFLGQVNIASVINLQPGNLDLTVRYIDLTGVLKGSVSTTLSPNLKQDFIINDLGLQPDTIGSVCVQTNAGSDGAWTGGVAIYKPDIRYGPVGFGEGFDFALYYPFSNPLTGVTTVPLNTFHLGTNPAALVANWVSIADASQGDGKGLSGVLRYFNDQGVVTKEEAVSIADGGRGDFSGHEGLSGAANYDAVGMAQFTPNSNTPYYLTLTRYFYDCPGASCNNFLTAFNIPRRPGSNASVSGGVSTSGGEIAIVELNNIGVSSSDTHVAVYRDTGNQAGNSVVSVPALGTRHIIVNQSGETGFLANDQVGMAQVAAQGGSISALSIFYKLSSVGVLEYAYAAPLVGARGDALLSQFNSFIEHKNNLEVYNTSGAARTVAVDFYDYLGNKIYGDNFALPGLGSKRYSNMALPADTYGTIIVQGDAPGVTVRNYVARAGEYTLPFSGE